MVENATNTIMNKSHLAIVEGNSRGFAVGPTAKWQISCGTKGYLNIGPLTPNYRLKTHLDFMCFGGGG